MLRDGEIAEVVCGPLTHPYIPISRIRRKAQEKKKRKRKRKKTGPRKAGQKRPPPPSPDLASPSGTPRTALTSPASEEKSNDSSSPGQDLDQPYTGAYPRPLVQPSTPRTLAAPHLRIRPVRASSTL